MSVRNRQLEQWWKAFRDDLVSEHYHDILARPQLFIVNVDIPRLLQEFCSSARFGFISLDGENWEMGIDYRTERIPSTGDYIPVALLTEKEPPARSDGVVDGALRGNARAAAIEEFMLHADSVREQIESQFKSFFGPEKIDALCRGFEDYAVTDLTLGDNDFGEMSSYTVSRLLSPGDVEKMRRNTRERLEAIQARIYKNLSPEERRRRSEVEQAYFNLDIDKYLDRVFDRRAGRLYFRLANLTAEKLEVTAEDVAKVCDWALTQPKDRQPGLRYETFTEREVKRWAEDIRREFRIKKLPQHLQLKDKTLKSKVNQVKF